MHCVVGEKKKPYHKFYYDHSEKRPNNCLACLKFPPGTQKKSHKSEILIRVC